MACVYVHISPNDKLYIGITTHDNASDRWGRCGHGYRSQKLFWRAIEKYGWNCFRHIVLIENVSIETACECEKFLIAKYRSNDPRYGYNRASGGDTNCGFIRTEEQRRKLSMSLKGKMVGEKNPRYGKPKSKEEIQAISNSLKGRKQSEECRRKRSEALKGHVVSEETRKKISRANTGKTLSPEARRKLSESHKGLHIGHSYNVGRKVSLETREKMSLAHKGKPKSEETKRKLSEACKGKKKGPMSEEQKQKIRETLLRRKLNVFV